MLQTSEKKPRPEVRHLVVDQDAGQRIDNFLIRELKGLPKSRVYRMLRRGEVRVNGGRIKPTYRLAAGDQVRIPPLLGMPGSAAREAYVGDAVLQRVSRSILFEDADLLVLNKPAGMPVHGGSGLAFGAIEALRRLRPDAALELAHRLDRDTSGCLLVAKSRPMLRTLHEALRERSVKKRYQLVVHGAWPRRLETVQLPLLRYLTASGERRVRVDQSGKACRTDFSIRAASNQAGAAFTRLDAWLHTGRTHQIRVHASASGHPIVGDAKYAGAGRLAEVEACGVARLCLHAEEVALLLNGRRRRFAAPLPEDFEAAWQRLASGA